MNNLRQSQSASVVDHFKQKQSTKLSTGSVDRKMWGSDNICIRKKKKFGGKKLAGAPVCGALAFLGGSLCKNGKWWGLGENGRKLGFILHKSWR
ncbi:MAG: hypothetical protein E7D99_00645 [Haemophilus parainfluenzae]|nr:hypothetical protein [Haemophilus parainfluenzae]